MSKLTLRKPYASPATKIYVFNFLCESESGVVRRLQEDMLIAANYSSDKGEPWTDFIDIFNIANEGQCYAAALSVIKDAEMGGLPLIHLQGHGAKDKGIKCTDGSYVSWQTLKELFEKVMYSARGELTVVAAACHSFALTEHVEQYSKTPYAFYYGYDKAITLREMEQDLTTLYQKFIVSRADISNSTLTIKADSEYDNLEAVRIALLVLTDPEQARKEGLSKTVLKKRLNLDLPASEARKKFNHMVQSPDLLIQVINDLFHPTRRRQYLLEDVLAYYDVMVREKSELAGGNG